MHLTRKLAAEFIGTFWLVLGGCGSAVLAAAFPHVGIGLLGVSLAFGLTIVAMAYTVGDVSGSIPVTNTSVNPARSTGPAVFVQGWALSQLWLFWVAPLLGGAIGALVYRFITPGKGATEPGY